MKIFASVILALAFFVVPPSFGQNAPKPVTFIQLMSTPDKFDGLLVSVIGFLVIGHDGGATATFLYLHKEDADNLLGNGVLVIPSDQMQRDDEKINYMYVVLTGTFRKSAIDVQSCIVWSDPSRPIGLKPRAPGPKNK
jgi:hypothetical protein